MSMASAAFGRLIVGAVTDITFGGLALPVKTEIAATAVPIIIIIPIAIKTQPITLLLFGGSWVELGVWAAGSIV